MAKRKKSKEKFYVIVIIFILLIASFFVLERLGREIKSLQSECYRTCSDSGLIDYVLENDDDMYADIIVLGCDAPNITRILEVKQYCKELDLNVSNLEDIRAYFRP
jgi:hypothetical protein